MLLASPALPRPIQRLPLMRRVGEDQPFEQAANFQNGQRDEIAVFLGAGVAAA